VSAILLEWAVKQGLQHLHIEQGKPWQNGTNESFDGKYRDGCLAMN
jgi:putative transposase